MKLFSIFLLLFITSCSLFSHEESGKKDKNLTQIRQFTWEFDTVGNRFSGGGGIHGFSDDNVFAMGSFYSDEKGTYLRGMRWDAEQWTDDYHIPNLEFLIASEDVTGDDSTLVAVGAWGGIHDVSIATARYSSNTQTWRQFKPDIEGTLLDVWTDGNGFYASVGYNGLVAISEDGGKSWNVEQKAGDYLLQGISGAHRDDYFIWGSRYNRVESTNQFAFWRIKNGAWIKLFDSLKPGETKAELSFLNDFIGYQFYAPHAKETDTTHLFLSDNNSAYRISLYDDKILKSQDLEEAPTNADNTDLRATWIFGTTKNDIWLSKSLLKFYQWNGMDLYETNITQGLPIDGNGGILVDFYQSNSGKVWMLVELRNSNQIYGVLQGTPVD